MDNFDYFSQGIEKQDTKVLANLSKLGQQLKKLQDVVDKKEEELDRAKKALQHFAQVVLPQQMYAAGVDSITLSDGGKLEIKNNYYCKPNKNPADKAAIYKWLREHNGSYLIEQKAEVSNIDVDKLESAGIPYVETSDVDTRRLKAFLKDGLGLTNGNQQFTVDDIPSCIHFQIVSTAEIN